MLITGARRGVVRVMPPVEIDLATKADFARQIAQASALHPARVIVDFEGVTFCDSTAVTVLLSAIEDMSTSGCALVIENPCRNLRLVTHVLHLGDALGLPPPRGSGLPSAA